MAGQSNHPDIAIGRYRVSVYVGDRSVQRFRRAPSGEHASKGTSMNRQQAFLDEFGFHPISRIKSRPNRRLNRRKPIYLGMLGNCALG